MLRPQEHRSAPLVEVLALLLAAASPLLGCAGIDARSDWDGELAFDNYRTFALMEPQQPAGGDPLDPTYSDLVYRRVQHAVTYHLTQRRYREVEPEKADFLVASHVTTQQKVSVHSYGDTYGYGYGYYRRGYYAGGGGTSVRTYTEGTLILDVVDRERNELVWRGWASQNVRKQPPQQEKVLEVVNAILDLFPPLEGS